MDQLFSRAFFRSVFVVRAFVRMREHIKANADVLKLLAEIEGALAAGGSAPALGAWALELGPSGLRPVSSVWSKPALTAQGPKRIQQGMITVISANGLLEIPESFRKADALKPGQLCDIERVGQGDYRVRVANQAEAQGPDVVAWLLSCPEKDWWEEPAGRSKPPLKPSHQFES